MAAPDFITISPNFNSYYFSDSTNNGLNVLGQADFQHQILPFQYRTIYFAKSVMSDYVSLQFHIFFSGIPTLYLCDRHQNIITGATASLNSAPFYKGLQVVTGNTWDDPFTHYTYGLTSHMYNFQWSDLASYVTANTPLSVYYLMFEQVTGGETSQIFSEPILLYNSTFDNWGNQDGQRNTLSFTAQYNANRAANTNVVVAGWYNDYPTSTQPYFPTFYTRCEGYVLPIDPKAVNFGYYMQNYIQNFQFGQQVPQKILKLGELSPGIPDYMLQIITEFLLSDQIIINGTWYKTVNQSSNTSPSDLWKSKRDDVSALLYANTVLSLGSLSQQAMVSPVPVPTGGIYDATFDATFM